MPEDTKQLDVRKLYNDLISYTRPEVMDDEDGYDDDDDVAVRQVDEYVKKQKQLVADIKQFIELPSEERHKIVQECREQCAAEGGALFTNRRFARFAAYNIAEKISSLIGSAKRHPKMNKIDLALRITYGCLVMALKRYLKKILKVL